MKQIIIELLKYQQTKTPSVLLLNAYNKLEGEIFTPISYLISWLNDFYYEKDLFNEDGDTAGSMSIKSDTGLFEKKIEIFFEYCPAISELFILDLEKKQISFLPSVSEKERGEIREYVAKNRKIKMHIRRDISGGKES